MGETSRGRGPRPAYVRVQSNPGDESLKTTVSTSRTGRKTKSEETARARKSSALLWLRLPSIRHLGGRTTPTHESTGRGN